MLKFVLIVVIILGSLELLSSIADVLRSEEETLKMWHKRTGKDYKIQVGGSFVMGIFWVLMMVLSGILLSNI